MKIDRTKIKRSTTEVVSKVEKVNGNQFKKEDFNWLVCCQQPPDCKALISRIVECKETQDLTELLKGVQTWTYGKCELFHWIDALDRFDGVLGKATHRPDGRWAMACDVCDNEGKEVRTSCGRIRTVGSVDCF